MVRHVPKKGYVAAERQTREGQALKFAFLQIAVAFSGANFGGSIVSLLGFALLGLAAVWRKLSC